MGLLGSFLTKKPDIVSFVFIILIITLIAGATKMKLATGNETLMSIDSKVYQDNRELEKYFGGESIILLSTSQQDHGILTVENLNRMKELEDSLQRYDDVYSFISPASIVNQLTTKQFEKMSGSLSDIQKGLQDMGGNLTEMSDSIEQKSSKSTSAEFAANIGEMSNKLELIGNQLESVEKSETLKNSELFRILKESRMMTNQLSEKLKGMTGNGNQVSAESQTNELRQLAEGLRAMGGKLLEISDGLAKLQSSSDIVHPGLPSNPTTLNTLVYDQGDMRPAFDELILDDKHSLIMIKLKGDIDDGTKGTIIDMIKEQLKRSPFEDVDTIITGKPIMDSAVHVSMQESMKKMIGIAVVLMMIVLTIVFHVRWRVLAIPVILVSVVATLGLMGYVSVPMTMVSMAVFPILIGLGVDYAIQFQNRYEEELSKGETIDA